MNDETNNTMDNYNQRKEALEFLSKEIPNDIKIVAALKTVAIHLQQYEIAARLRDREKVLAEEETQKIYIKTNINVWSITYKRDGVLFHTVFNSGFIDDMETVKECFMKTNPDEILIIKKA